MVVTQALWLSKHSQICSLKHTKVKKCGQNSCLMSRMVVSGPKPATSQQSPVKHSNHLIRQCYITDVNQRQCLKLKSSGEKETKFNEPPKQTQVTQLTTTSCKDNGLYGGSTDFFQLIYWPQLCRLVIQVMQVSENLIQHQQVRD